MQPNFTPGPWQVAGQSEAGRYIKVQAPSGRTVARIPFSRESAPLSEITDASDAYLIAAAPAMYATLVEITRCSSIDEHWLAPVRAAIRLARGEAWISFHAIIKRKAGRNQALARTVTARLVNDRGFSRAFIIISGDLLAHLHARPGDFVRPLIGYGEDHGDFALERVSNRRDGYTLSANLTSRVAHFTTKASDFVPLTPGVVTRFDVEAAPGRIICRAPQALAQAAE